MANSLQNLVFQLSWPTHGAESAVRQFDIANVPVYGQSAKNPFERSPHLRKRCVTRSARLYSTTASRILFTSASCASASTPSLAPKDEFLQIVLSVVDLQLPHGQPTEKLVEGTDFAVTRSNLLLGAGGHVRKDLLAFSVGQVGWRAALLQRGCFGVPSNTSGMLPLSCRGGGMFAPRLSPL